METLRNAGTRYSQQNVDCIAYSVYNNSINKVVRICCLGVLVMVNVNVNEIISNNIMNIMKQHDRKQVDLAGYLGVSKQVTSRMLSGARMINAIELQKIAEFLNVSMESLVKPPQVLPETDTVKAFMGKAHSREAKEGLAIADELANLICFYARTHENAKEMMQPWEA